MDIIVNGTLSTTLEEYFSKGPLTAEEFLDAGYGLRLSGSYVCANGDRLSLLKTDEMGENNRTLGVEWPRSASNGHQ
jgi:hypothetical protein